MRKIIYLTAFLLLTFCILTNSSMSLFLAAKGLQLWFQNMIPALLPVMILSGTLIRMGLTEGFTTLVYPFVKPVFRVSRNVCYVMIMGFLCGFPMGAKCVSDMYAANKISSREAEFLLAFCNNIGPVYFVSFALPVIGCTGLGLPLLGMYGLPLLYGLFLRYTAFKEIGISPHNPEVSKELSFLPAMDAAIYAALQSMLMLGGYMILFNLLLLVPALSCPTALPYLAPIFEITGGLSILGTKLPIYSLIVLPFGGLSCIAQTYTCIKDTDLSLAAYVRHKLILTLLTAGYYLLLRFLRLL